MTRGVFVGLTAFAVLLGVPCHQSQAADINGAWLSDAALCSKVFRKEGQQLSFAPGLDPYGNGFIVEGNQIRGRMARCTIKARREQGALINLIAVCSTDIAIDTMQFRLRIEGPNKIVREFAGMPDMEIAYERCAI
jgi:hypothetical protein